MARGLHTVDHLRRAAQCRLPRLAFDFMDGGAGRETALCASAESFARLRLMPRALAGNVTRDLSTTLLGRRYALPIGIAPIGMAGFIWPGADGAFARAAVAADIPYCLSTAGTASIERIAALAPDHGWFQLYVGRDEAITRDLVTRARAAACPVLVVTVDVPAPGKRVRDLLNGFALPFKLTPRILFDMACHPAWTMAMARQGAPRFANLERYAGPDSGVGSLAQLMAAQSSARLDWAELARIRDQWGGKLVVKGIIDPTDAKRAADEGYDGVIVSNHGGRQLDAAPATIDALPRVRATVGDRIAVMVDGGIRTGEDIAKAIVSGADFVWLGRAFLYAIAALGPEAGPRKVIDLLRDEFDRALAMLGCHSVADITADRLWPAHRA